MGEIDKNQDFQEVVQKCTPFSHPKKKQNYIVLSLFNPTLDSDILLFSTYDLIFKIFHKNDMSETLRPSECCGIAYAGSLPTPRDLSIAHAKKYYWIDDPGQIWWQGWDNTAKFSNINENHWFSMISIDFQWFWLIFNDFHDFAVLSQLGLSNVRAVINHIIF